MIVEFHPDAEMEFIEAAAYYDARVPGLGDQLAANVAAATSLLQALRRWENESTLPSVDSSFCDFPSA